MWEMTGYKAFNHDYTNMHGKVFEEGKSYQTSKNIQFYKSGYHLCKHLPHVFCYYYPVEEVKVAQVLASGKYHYLDYDDYKGIYDLYAVEQIYIDHFLKRQEIIAKVLEDIPYNQKIFLQYVKLTKEELAKFVFQNANDYGFMQCLLYTQLGYKNIYTMDYENVKKLIREWKNG